VDTLVCDAAPAFAAAGLRAALDGTWNATRAVVNAALRPAGGGKVVLVAPAPGAGEHAGAVAAALENLARTLSVEWARYAVRPTAILPGWEGLAVAAEMSRRLGDLPVHLDNDANLGALAEVTLGAARDARNALYVMVSSGIGAGLIVDGRPYRGGGGMAGEIGHVLVDETGPICRCGNRGCLETYISGPAISDLLRRSRGEDLNIADVVRLAHGGDAGCQRAIADAGRVLGRAVAAICNVLNPDTVVVGGDLGEAGDLLLDPMREAVGRYAIAPAAEDARVVAGVLGERAQVLGALALALLQSEHLAARLAPHPIAIQRGGRP
jgi:predicted NBD/HSP70 family sugar kinase